MYQDCIHCSHRCCHCCGNTHPIIPVIKCFRNINAKILIIKIKAAVIVCLMKCFTTRCLCTAVAFAGVTTSQLLEFACLSWNTTNDNRDEKLITQVNIVLEWNPCIWFSECVSGYIVGEKNTKCNMNSS